MSVCDIQAIKSKENPPLSREKLHVQCHGSAVDTSAEQIGCSPDNVSVLEQKAYWQIAKPLVAELCSQWAQDYERAGCTVGALLTYLRNMYEAFQPHRAVYHGSTNPLDYVYAINSHLRDDHRSELRTPAWWQLSTATTSGDVSFETLPDVPNEGSPKAATAYKDQQDGVEELHPAGRPRSNEDGVTVDSDTGPSEHDGAQSDAFLESHPNSEINTSPHPAADFARIVRDGMAQKLGSLPPLVDITTDEGEISPSLGTPGTTGSAATYQDPLFVPPDDQGVNTLPATPWNDNQILPGAVSHAKTIGNWSSDAFQIPTLYDPDLFVDDWGVPDNLDQAMTDTSPLSATSRVIPDTDTYLTPDTESPTSCTRTYESLYGRANDATDLRDTLAQQWPDTDRIILHGSILTHADIEQILDELQNYQQLSIPTVDFLSDHFSYYRPPLQVYIADTAWPDRLHRGVLRLIPIPQIILLPTYVHGRWSLIEIQACSGAVIHYSFTSIEPGLHEMCDPCYPVYPACTSCRDAIEALSQHLRDVGELSPEWKFYNRAIATTNGDEGTCLLWAIKQRVNDQSVQEELPEDFRGSLNREIVARALHAASESRLSLPSALSSSRKHTNVLPEKTQQRWSAVTSQWDTPNDITRIRERIAQMPLNTTVRIGSKQADRLLQLAFTIASPPVLVELRRQLLHLRQKQTAANSSFQRTPAGVFKAGIWHKDNKYTSRIGLALTCWYVHNHRQQRHREGYPDPTAQTVVDICRQLPESTHDCHQVEERVKAWYKRAWPWNQLVRIASSPNVLCFLPQGVSFAGKGTLSMTDYRTLKKAHFEAFEVIFKEYRPRLLQFIPSNFFEVFLYNRLPAGQYRIEQWTEKDILAEPLGSEKFDRAFDLLVE
ncbi:hypothetical protein BDV37DRAFT_289499 [Aspergillus pseudonomiae]|uniref:Uncharacterized protein n=1 Tax=Aspergillus pseudonomiae TaxID=1506151 RepID=A0A5N7CT28_9EURO|nr:uncharacterized protein BDV37DRAFT_289499 [Aspergillus pseudonomiae]KAE8397356.1 hypothetical protein BDV37DRAFT_289499 [Aspergillus pseudonomiae]